MITQRWESSYVLKSEAIVKYSVLSEGKQLFASRYKLYLPTEEEFKRMLESIE